MKKRGVSTRTFAPALVVTVILLLGAVWFFQPVNPAVDDALLRAARQGDKAQVVKLLADGANANAQQKPSRWENLVESKPDAYEGYTPLMFVIQSGHPEIVPLLLEKGADVNIASEIGNTALMSAVKQGDGALVKLLVKHKADVNAKNKFGSDAVFFANKRVMSKQYEDIIVILEAAGAKK